MRRLLAVRGRTGAVMMVQPSLDEGGGVTVSKVIHANVPARCLQQIRSFACDAPSNHMFDELKKLTMPNLEFLACGPAHLCINY